MSKCYNCRGEHTNNDMLCDTCLPNGVTEFPGTSGLSDGPSSGNHEMVFDRPDAKKDIELTCKKMEENGTFLRNPKLKALADYKYAKSKEMNYQKADYQKTGTPNTVQGRAS